MAVQIARHQLPSPDFAHLQDLDDVPLPEDPNVHRKRVSLLTNLQQPGERSTKTEVRTPLEGPKGKHTDDQIKKKEDNISTGFTNQPPPRTADFGAEQGT